MEQKELLSWAIKGLYAEIQELEKTIQKGEKYYTKVTQSNV